MQFPILSDLTMRRVTVHLRHCLQTKHNTIQTLILQAQIKNKKSFPYQEQREFSVRHQALHVISFCLFKVSRVKTMTSCPIQNILHYKY